MAFCPAVCSYRVEFSDGTVMYPRLPGHVDVYALANQYARETLSKGLNTPVTVVSIQSMD